MKPELQYHNGQETIGWTVDGFDTWIDSDTYTEDTWRVFFWDDAELSVEQVRELIGNLTAACDTIETLQANNVSFDDAPDWAGEHLGIN